MPRRTFVPRRRPGSRVGGADSKQAGGKIIPIKILFLDQPDLPCSFPFLHLKLAVTSLLNVVEGLKPNQLLAAVSLREPRNHSLAVLPNALHEIARHPNVDRSVFPTRHNVD